MIKLSFLKRTVLGIILVVLIILLIISLILPLSFTLIIVNFFLLYVMVLFLLIYVDKGNFGKIKQPKILESVTILVPVYNSIGTIKNCIAAVKNINYAGKLEIIIVDDGSTDGSREFLEKVRGIKLIKMKKNSGKATALNTALKQVKTKFVACIDSDTYPEKDLLNKTLGYFEEENVNAVTCLILPDKKESVIQKIQFFEYAVSFGLGCTIFSYLDSMSVIPGPMTIFKRSVFDEIGYYDTKNLTEDMEIGLRLQRFHKKIRVCYEARAYTDIPNTWQKLFKQRDRWYRGRIFNLMNYKDLFFNTKNKNLGFFSIPYLFSLELISMLLLVRIALMAVNNVFVFLSSEVLSFSLTNTILITAPQIFVTSTMVFFFFFYLVVFLYIYLAIKMVGYNPNIKDIVVILINILLYPLFITIVYGQSFFKELLGVGAKWERVSI